MRRRLLTLAVIALCTAKLFVVALWAASLFRYDIVSYRSPGYRVTISFVTSDGGLGASLTIWTPRKTLDASAIPVHSVSGWHWSSLPHVGRGGIGLEPLHVAPHLLGIGARIEAFDQSLGRTRRVIVVAPYWFLLITLALPSLLLARRTLRQSIYTRRIARGQCPACGYDLRGSIEIDAPATCPECGAPLSSASPTATPAPTPVATAASTH